MNVAALALLAVTAAAGAVLWYVVEHRSERASTSLVVTAAAVPALLLATAALFGAAGGPAGDVLLGIARPAAVAAALSSGGLVAIALLRLADRSTGLIDDDSGSGDASARVSDPRTLRGGTSIGVLERIAVSVTLLAGWPEGLALVLAVKGLGRYPELRRPPAAERFIIGTLASVLWAVAVVGVVHTLRS